MKRALILILCAMLSLVALSGCDKQEVETSIFKQADDIYTYRRVDPAKTVLTVSNSGNIFTGDFCREFELANPDVQIINLDITGGSDNILPVNDWLLNGLAPDIMFVTAGLLDASITSEYFEDLSGNTVVSNFQTQALDRLSINGRVYWLPGPSKIDCLIYNKTLFERYGWQIPNTFDEFVDLCVRIREDTNGEVQPWNPNAKYVNELQIALEAFVYADLFAGVANREWYENFLEGKATFAGHMEPMYENVQKLADAGLLLEEHFTYSATTRGNEFQAGKIAIANFSARIFQSDEFEFSYMPFPGKTADDAYLSDTIFCCLGVPKKQHTDKEKDAIERFLQFYASVQGQQVLIKDSLMVSNVKNVPLSHAEQLSSLQATVDKGHMFTVLDFSAPGMRKVFSIHGDAHSIVQGKTVADCIRDVDANPYIPMDVFKSEPPEVIATAADDFTILETSCYLADMYREKAGAQIGLIANNIAYRGNLMRIFKGDLVSANALVLKPRSFDNNSTLVKLSMTGAQLLDALNDPLGNEQQPNCIYAYSGLKCKIAPWNDMGKKYLSVTLSDGTAIKPDEIYTVAAWAGTVREQYVTEILETFEGTFEQLLSEKLIADKVIAPANDGRFELSWE